VTVDSASDLLDAIEFAKANKLIDDGSAKKIDQLTDQLASTEDKRKECEKKFQEEHLKVGSSYEFITCKHNPPHSLESR